MTIRRFPIRIAAVAVLLMAGWAVLAEDAPTTSTAKTSLSTKPLTELEQQQIDAAVDRALTWMATQQSPDGSFRTLDVGQPGVTGICIMAYLAAGHLPGEGKYGDTIDKAIDYVLACQKPDGLLVNVDLSTGGAWSTSSLYTAAYNHAISGLALCEVYGMVAPEKSARVREVIEKAIGLALAQQKKTKTRSIDQGGWRYLAPVADGVDSDLSITSWNLMFLRAARNAGFAIPNEPIDRAMEYVRRTFDPQRGTFMYYIGYPTSKRSMAGAGIYALALGGVHDSETARSVADWLLKYPFDRYNEGITHKDRFHYSAYYCAMAMFQMGGRYWDEFYPTLARTLIANQSADGSWQPEQADGNDRPYGNVYTTAFCVQALCMPYQLLPIFQR